jgi:hypothetical protein
LSPPFLGLIPLSVSRRWIQHLDLGNGGIFWGTRLRSRPARMDRPFSVIAILSPEQQ